MALSVPARSLPALMGDARPILAVSQHTALRSPDFPPRRAGAITRPARRSSSSMTDSLGKFNIGRIQDCLACPASPFVLRTFGPEK